MLQNGVRDVHGVVAHTLSARTRRTLKVSLAAAYLRVFHKQHTIDLRSSRSSGSGTLGGARTQSLPLGLRLHGGRPRRDRSGRAAASPPPAAGEESLQHGSLPRLHARNSALELLRRAAWATTKTNARIRPNKQTTPPPAPTRVEDNTHAVRREHRGGYNTEVTPKIGGVSAQLFANTELFINFEIAGS